jgi:hypothetical protein
MEAFEHTTVEVNSAKLHVARSTLVQLARKLGPVKTRIPRDVATARRPGRRIPVAMGTAGWAQAEADRARIRSVLRAPPGWRAPATTSVPASTTQHGAPIIQRKLIVGEVNDPFEHEADRVADRVMRMADPSLSITAAPVRVSRACAACEEEMHLNSSPTPTASSALS